MSPLLECVPNFSVGRDRALLEQLVAAMSVPAGVACLARELDPDHNRAVITLAGTPAAVAEAALCGARLALAAIDLRQHAGVHMRMGAFDVCPFVPLRGASMELAVATAVAVGEAIAAELQVPVFLYGNAARRPERRVLGAVRNLGFEELQRRVGTDPGLAPDFGPPRLHPSAGAVAVGARPLLVAYNVNLDTDDLGIARSVARQVRESSGGLPGVQARGFFLAERGLAQVSMNLLDAAGATSIRVAFDAVVAACSAAGVAVVESELIGLVSEEVLDLETAHHVKLIDFDAERQVLEARLRAHGLI